MHKRGMYKDIHWKYNSLKLEDDLNVHQQTIDK